MIIEMRRQLKDMKAVWFIAAIAMMLPAGGMYMIFKSPTAGPTAGYVDGKPVSVMHYRHSLMREQMYRSQLASYGFDQFAGPVDTSQVFRSCCEDVLLDDIAKKLSITIGQRALQETLAEGVASHVIRGDGKVDMEAYRQMIASTLQTDIGTYEAELEGEIKRDVVRELVKQASYVPRHVLESKNALSGIKKQFQIVSLPFAHFIKKAEAAGASEKQLTTFYEKHKTDYMSEEVRKIRFTHLDDKMFLNSVEVSEFDLSEHYNRYMDTRYAQPALYKVRTASLSVPASSGESERVKSVLEGISSIMKSQGQDKDLLEVSKAEARKAKISVKTFTSDTFELNKGTFPEKVERGIGRLKESGDISQIISTADQYYLVQLVIKTPPVAKAFDVVKGEILEILRKRKAAYLARSTVEQFMRACYDDPESFNGFIKKHNLKISHASYSDKDKVLFGAQKNSLVRVVFDWKRNVPHAGYVPADDGYTLFSLDSIERPKVKPFKQVEGDVKQAYIQAEAKKLSKKTVNFMHVQGLQEADLKKLADDEGVELIQTGLLSRDSELKNPRNVGSLLREAFELSDEKQLLCHQNAKDRFLVQFVGEQSINGDESKKPASFKRLNDSMLEVDYLQGFVASLLRDARIEAERALLEFDRSDRDSQEV